MKNNKGFIGMGMLIAIIAALIVGGGAVYLATKKSAPTLQNIGNNILPPVNQNSRVNTPVQNNSTSNIPSKVSPVSMPTTLPQYMGTYQNGWPPIVQNSSTVYSCTTLHSETEDTVEKIINGKIYCVNRFTDCGAGSCGGNYTYIRADGAGTKKGLFKLYWPSCGVWRGDGTTKYTDCQTSQSTFFNNLDVLIDNLI